MADIDPDSLVWRKSSFSETASCVEVAPCDGGIALRDTKNREKGFFFYNAGEWTAFLSGVRNGEFDNLVDASHR